MSKGIDETVRISRKTVRISQKNREDFTEKEKEVCQGSRFTTHRPAITFRQQNYVILYKVPKKDE